MKTKKAALLELFDALAEASNKHAMTVRLLNSHGPAFYQFKRMRYLLKSVQAQFEGACVEITEFKAQLDELLSEIEK